MLVLHVHVGSHLVFSQGCEIALIASQLWQHCAVPHQVSCQVFLLRKFLLTYWAEQALPVVILHMLSQVLFSGCRELTLTTRKASAHVSVEVGFKG